MSLGQTSIAYPNREDGALASEAVSPLGGDLNERSSPWWFRRRALRRQIFHPNNFILGLSCAVLAIVFLWAAVPSLFSPDTAVGAYPTQVLQPPLGKFFLGTDQYGRSIYAELVYGARSAVLIGVLATAGSAIVGSLMGIAAGYIGGATDMVIMRVVDVLLALPGLFLALIFVAALSPNLMNLIIAVGVQGIPAYARVLRAQALQVRGRLYVDAATVLGVARWKILARHIVPNCLAPVLVLAAIGFGFAIIIGATLAFLGLGPTTPPLNWGALIASGQGYVNQDWWITTFPGLMITAVVIAVNVLGDWLRDHMEPTSR